MYSYRDTHNLIVRESSLFYELYFIVRAKQALTVEYRLLIINNHGGQTNFIKGFVVSHACCHLLRGVNLINSP